MNTPVSFEIAKLLREKGFDNKTYKSYRISINPDREIGEAIPDKITYFPNVKESIAAPTISEVVMWLYEKHGIWISVEYSENVKWCSKIVIFPKKFIEELMNNGSPTEAYEAAIEYTLINLIK